MYSINIQYMWITCKVLWPRQSHICAHWFYGLIGRKLFLMVLNFKKRRPRLDPELCGKTRWDWRPASFHIHERWDQKTGNESTLETCSIYRLKRTLQEVPMWHSGLGICHCHNHGVGCNSGRSSTDSWSGTSTWVPWVQPKNQIHIVPSFFSSLFWGQKYKFLPDLLPNL